MSTFSSTINVRGAVTLEVRVDAAGEFSGSVPLPLTPLPAFAVGQSIVVTPFAYTTLNFFGTADAGARVSLVAPFEAGVWFELPGDPTAAANELLTHERHPALSPRVPPHEICRLGSEPLAPLTLGEAPPPCLDGLDEMRKEVRVAAPERAVEVQKAAQEPAVDAAREQVVAQPFEREWHEKVRVGLLPEEQFEVEFVEPPDGLVHCGGVAANEPEAVAPAQRGPAVQLAKAAPAVEPEGPVVHGPLGRVGFAPGRPLAASHGALARA